MARLADYVEIMEDNTECVVLKVRPGSRMGLIGLGCFNGDEEMVRLTKGRTQTCTVFPEGGRPYSWEWGDGGSTLVSDGLSKMSRMVQECITHDFGIRIEGEEADVGKTLGIRNG